MLSPSFQSGCLSLTFCEVLISVNISPCCVHRVCRWLLANGSRGGTASANQLHLFNLQERPSTPCPQDSPMQRRGRANTECYLQLNYSDRTHHKHTLYTYCAQVSTCNLSRSIHRGSHTHTHTTTKLCLSVRAVLSSDYSMTSAACAVHCNIVAVVGNSVYISPNPSIW